MLHFEFKAEHLRGDKPFFLAFEDVGKLLINHPNLFKEENKKCKRQRKCQSIQNNVKAEK